MLKLSPNLRSALNVVIVLVIFLAIYAYAMFQGGFVSWFLFYSVAFLLLISLVVLLFPLKSLSVSRKINKQVFRDGEKLIVTVTVNRKNRFPFIFLLVKDHLPNELKTYVSPPGASKLFFFSLKKELTLSYEIKFTRRGQYHFPLIEIKAGDFFGLFTKVNYYKVEDTVLVYPNYQEIESWTIAAHDESPSHSSYNHYGEDVAGISGVRDYVQGDRLHNIHWRASARANKLMTKEFEVYHGQSYMLVVDGYLKSRNETALLTFERAIEFAASVVRYSMQTKMLLGFISVGEEVVKFPIQNNQGHQINIFQQLARTMYTKKKRLPEALPNIARELHGGMIIVVISTTINEGTITSLKKVDMQKVKVVYCLFTDEKSSNRHEQSYMNELQKMNVELYLMKSNNFNDDLKAGESHVRS